jgi:protein-disulfide isomerase
MEDAPSLTLPVSERDHIEGELSAPVTLVEYGDYQCPYCGAAYPVVKKVQKHFGNRVKFVFRNFPLNELHEYAELAAESAEASAAQGKFWEMHDALYEHQHSLGEELIESLANKLGLDIETFNREVSSRKYKPRVREDFMSGVTSGVNGTPTFFINGVRYNANPDFANLVGAIEDELR